MKSIFGKIVVGVAEGLNTILEIFMLLIRYLVGIAEILRQWIKMIGCLVLSIFFFLPIVLLMYRIKPQVYMALIIIWVFPMLGKKFLHYLEYLKYSLIESMRDYGNYLQGNRTAYRTFSYFSKEFQRKEYEEEMRRRQEYQRRQQQMWEERFKEYFGNAYYYTDYTNFGQYHRQNYQQGNTQNPMNGFVAQYEKCCDILGVSYDVDMYQLKLQYRKMAKKYHPDINQAPDAKEKFQEINNAYDFLSDENNIQRYKRFKS